MKTILTVTVIKNDEGKYCAELRAVEGVTGRPLGFSLGAAMDICEQAVRGGVARLKESGIPDAHVSFIEGFLAATNKSNIADSDQIMIIRERRKGGDHNG